MERLASQSERDWILIGLAESCAERGYEATTVETVCAAGGVAPESFAHDFANLDECLGAAMEAFVEEAWRRLDATRPAEAPWAAALREGVVALLDLSAERPDFARLALVEAPVAGGRAAAQYGSAKAALLAFLERAPELAEPEIPASAARGALAGAEALVVGELLAARGKDLRGLGAGLTYLLAVPFLGRDESLRLAEGPSARGHLRAVA